MTKRNDRLESLNAESLYDENWKVLREFHNRTEAEMVLDLLSQQGIPAYILGGDASAWWRGKGISRICVRACDQDTAGRLLRELEDSPRISEEELAEEALGSGPPPEEQ